MTWRNLLVLGLDPSTRLAGVIRRSGLRFLGEAVDALLVERRMIRGCGEQTRRELRHLAQGHGIGGVTAATDEEVSAAPAANDPHALAMLIRGSYDPHVEAMHRRGRLLIAFEDGETVDALSIKEQATREAIYRAIRGARRDRAGSGWRRGAERQQT